MVVSLAVLIIPLILLLLVVVVVPVLLVIWIVRALLGRQSSVSLKREEQAQLVQLNAGLTRMEQRIENLETILMQQAESSEEARGRIAPR